MGAKVIEITTEEVAEVSEKLAAESTAADNSGKETKRRVGRPRKSLMEKKTKEVKTRQTKSRQTKNKEEKTTATGTPVRKVKANVTIQFEGKSYSQEQLVKIARDVWKYDLKKKLGDLKSVELYVKPEEATCYYVMNNEIAGSFYL